MNLKGEDAKWFCLVCSGRESDLMYRLGAWLFKFSNKSYFVLNFKLRSTKSSACHARTVAESFNISSNNK